MLWERELAEIGEAYDNTSHQPGANAIGSNYASAEDAIYVAYGDRCLRVDPAPGETMTELTLPSLPRQAYRPVRIKPSVTGTPKASKCCTPSARGSSGCA